MVLPEPHNDTKYRSGVLFVFIRFPTWQPLSIVEIQPVIGARNSRPKDLQIISLHEVAEGKFTLRWSGA
jgi:hypothetical protein